MGDQAKVAFREYPLSFGFDNRPGGRTISVADATELLRAEVVGGERALAAGVAKIS